MEFRASSNGATELQTATFISTIYLSVSQLPGLHLLLKTIGEFFSPVSYQAEANG